MDSNEIISSISSAVPLGHNVQNKYLNPQLAWKSWVIYLQTECKSFHFIFLVPRDVDDGVEHVGHRPGCIEFRAPTEMKLNRPVECT